jgi:DNA-directed RNA polymerase subunit RPC12/RpoP
MPVRERRDGWSDGGDVEPLVRAVCMRCHREYTRDPGQSRSNNYCWWCSARIGVSATPIGE